MSRNIYVELIKNRGTCHGHFHELIAPKVNNFFNILKAYIERYLYALYHRTIAGNKLCIYSSDFAV